MMPFEIKARLVITSKKLSSDDMSSLIDVVPTEVWSVGDPMRYRDHGRRNSGWLLRSGCSVGSHVAEHVAAILRQVEGSSKGLAMVGMACDLMLSIAIFGYERLPNIYLSSAQMQRLARLRIDLDFDLYNLGHGGEDGQEGSTVTAGRILPVVPFDVRARLEISSLETSAEDISDHLCIDPSSTWVRGDTSEIDGTRFENHGWCLNSRFPPHALGEYHLSDIADRFEPMDWVLADLEGTCKFTVRLGVIRIEHFPSLTLDSCLMRRLAALKMGVEIELDDLGGSDLK